MPKAQTLQLRNLPELAIPFFQRYVSGDTISVPVVSYKPVSFADGGDYYICLHIAPKGNIVMTPVNKATKQRVAEFLASRTGVVISTLYAKQRNAKQSSRDFMRNNLFASQAVGSFKGLSAYNAKFSTSSKAGQAYAKAPAGSKLATYAKASRLERTYQSLKASNIDNLAIAAKIEAGKVFITNIKKLVVPTLPFALRGYADHPLFDVALANVLSALTQQFSFTSGDKFQWAVEAAMLASTTEAVASYDIPAFVNKHIDALTEGVTGLFGSDKVVATADATEAPKASKKATKAS